MKLDMVWLLLALPIAFGLGWLASRLDLRQLRLANRSAPKAYFMGLNYLLNEQQDAAIDAFIEAVQKDPDTSELHFALGNLFRRRGEYERAIRVHEHLLARADLSSSDRNRAQFALAQDFLKAGVFNLAEEALKKLDNTPYSQQAHAELLNMYERIRDWQNAIETAQKLEQLDSQYNFSRRRAHYLCEQAQAAQQQNQLDTARKLLQQAIAQEPQSARAYMQAASLEAAQNNHPQALQLLQQAMQHSPNTAPLCAHDYARIAHRCNQAPAAQTQLEQLYQAIPCVDFLVALAWLDSQQNRAPSQTTQRYLHHLEQTPSLIAASCWLELNSAHPNHPDHNAAGQKLVLQALQKATKPLQRYRCAACGFEAQRHYWHCPGCHSWDSYPARRLEELH